VNVITHALLPVTARLLTELRKKPLPGYRQQLRECALIGAAGLLPDALDPHVTIGARCSSYSHAWMSTAIAVAGCVVWALIRRRQTGLALWCAGAYVLHVLGDIVSGGLDFFATGHAIGDWWVIPELWPLIDLAAITVFVLVHRKVRRQYGLDPSVLRVLRQRFTRAG